MQVCFMEKALHLPADPSLDRIITFVSCVVGVEACAAQVISNEFLLRVRQWLVNRIFEQMLEHVQVREVQRVHPAAAHAEPFEHRPHEQFNVPMLPPSTCLRRSLRCSSSVRALKRARSALAAAAVGR